MNLQERCVFRVFMEYRVAELVSLSGKPWKECWQEASKEWNDRKKNGAERNIERIALQGFRELVSYLEEKG